MMMVHWRRLSSTIGDEYAITALGILNVGLAVGRLYLSIAGTAPLVEGVLDSLLIGGVGLILVYRGLRLPDSNIAPEVYSRITGWSVGSGALLLLVVGLLSLVPNGTLDNSVEAAGLAFAIGNIGGYAIGRNEARALTRARDAEQHAREAQRNERKLEQEKNRIESFAGMLAHELRNPLTIAKIYHQQSKEGDAEAAMQVEYAHDRIEEMIDILLITARSGETSIDRETVLISDIADDVWDELTPESATLIVETDHAIEVDPVHFQHLLKNLFSNAVEHGGDEVTIQVGALEEGFYVADDGPGIPEEKHDVVFEAGHTSKTDGIGLGLTFVGELTKMYDWDCVVSESADGGTRVECTGVDLTSPEQRSVS